MTRYRIFSIGETVVSIDASVIMLACIAGAVGLQFFLLYVVCIALVFIHELGHFLAARRHGLAVHNIALNFVGAATLISMLSSASPKTQFDVAVAGPLASLLASVILFMSYVLFPVEFVFNVAMLNLVFIFFGNILPLYPLDGGRMTLAIIMHMHSDKPHAQHLDKMIITQWYMGLITPAVICVLFGWVYALVVLVIAVVGLFMLLMQRRLKQ